MTDISEVNQYVGDNLIQNIMIAKKEKSKDFRMKYRVMSHSGLDDLFFFVQVCKNEPVNILKINAVDQIVFVLSG